MDHRWDESTWQDRAARGEREHSGASRIARDPDVERRDRLCLAERMRLVNQSQWAIGEAWYDQRDTYTLNASVEADGYGCGPSTHPDEGSYAYPREHHPGILTADASHASLYEREAWPWLNYKEAEDDPYFSHLHPHEAEGGFWQRLRDRLSHALHLRGARPAIPSRPDDRLARDVELALLYRGDLDASDVEIRVQDAEVTLEGTVTDRRSKRVAEEVAAAVEGVRGVHNRLTIRHDDPTDANVAFVLPLALMRA